MPILFWNRIKWVRIFCDRHYVLRFQHVARVASRQTGSFLDHSSAHRSTEWRRCGDLRDGVSWSARHGRRGVDRDRQFPA